MGVEALRDAPSLPLCATWESSSANSWLMHGEPRCLHPLQEVLAICGSKMHFIFLRLHSQQLCVPLRTFLRFAFEKVSCDGATRGDDIGSTRRWVWDSIPAERETLSCATAERRAQSQRPAVETYQHHPGAGVSALRPPFGRKMPRNGWGLGRSA